jgi:hypothetical protein
MPHILDRGAARIRRDRCYAPCVGRTRLFHSVVIVGAGLLANCGKHAAPPAAGSAANKSADAAGPADAAVDAAADAAVDASVDAAVDAGMPRHVKPKPVLPRPPDHPRIMVMRRNPPKFPQILESQ